MKRTVIEIDEAKCNGCGICVNACHEGAIGLVDGKAKLLRDDYCDGLGDCLPACPTDAITFIEREAVPYDATAVAAAKHDKNVAVARVAAAHHNPGGGCPSAAAHVFERTAPAAPFAGCPSAQAATITHGEQPAAVSEGPLGSDTGSALAQWPCQIKLVSPNAGFFQGADLLIAADCTAFACGDFHRRFIEGRVTIVGCPKLDAVDYSEKLTAIFAGNDIRSITVTLMEVPCCNGLGAAVDRALEASGKDIPVEYVTLSLDGRIL